jgi:hypothetical protein
MTFNLRISTFLAFVLLSPLMTFVLLWMKGLPDFAEGKKGEVILWVYGMTWVPALITGLLLSVLIARIVRKINYFHKPYDVGRCLSLGAVLGATIQGLATHGYRMVQGLIFSSFWIATGAISGAIVGAIVVAVVLSRFSKVPTSPS